MHNDYARRILAECGDNAQLKAIAMKYIPELPKASKGGDIQLYKAACDGKLEAFRSAARDLGLGNLLVQHEEASQLRHDLSETTADLRSVNEQLTTTQVGQAVIEELGDKMDAVGADVKQTVVNTGNNVVKRVNANTNRKINKAVANINAHTTAETDRGISANAQNTSAMLGVDAYGYTVKDENGDRELYNGFVVADENSAVGKNLHNMRVLHGVDYDNSYIEDCVVQVTTDGKEVYRENTTLGRMDKTRDDVNNHTTAEATRVIEQNRAQHEKTRQAVQDNNVLQAKRQTLSDMLGHEDIENFGVYRDSTVKWLGGSADKIMSNNKLNQKQKEEALDELTRMADEESVITDGDKEEFNKKYKLQ